VGQRRNGELLLVAQDRTYPTRDEARVDVFDYIERFYPTIHRIADPPARQLGI